MAPQQGEEASASWAARCCHQQTRINIKRGDGWGCENEVIREGGRHNEDFHPQPTTTTMLTTELNVDHASLRW